MLDVLGVICLHSRFQRRTLLPSWPEDLPIQKVLENFYIYFWKIDLASTLVTEHPATMDENPNQL